MKFFILLFFFLFTQAFAAECTPEVIDVFFRQNTVHQVSESRNFDHYTSVEKNLIHRTVKNEKFYAHVSQAEALRIFADIDGGGYLAGKIVYILVGYKTIVKVHYFPGDNEYGVIYEQKYQADFKKVAEIKDGDIFCK